MRVLLTGSNGLLGQKLVELLAPKSNVQLLATSRGENRVTSSNSITYKSLDVTNKQEVLNIINDFLPDVIINTAALTNVDLCEQEKDLCWNINVNAVTYLIEASKINDSHLIHLSTDFVFDGEDGPYTEVDKPNPLSYYGKSKLEAEKLLQASNIKWSIVRTIIVYGVAEKMSRSNIVLWAKRSLEKQQQLTIVDDQFRSPTLAEDLAEGCWLVAKNKATGIFHISGKDFMSIYDLVLNVADFFKLDKNLVTPCASSTLNQAAKRPPKTGFIIDKAVNQIGYNPRSFKQGLQIVSKQLNN